MDVICPNCFSRQMVKQGLDKGRQRYGCKKCRYKTVHPLSPDDAEILKENVKLAKQKQSLQDLNRVERKTFREYARIENAVGAYNKELVKIFNENKLSNDSITLIFSIVNSSTSLTPKASFINLVLINIFLK